MPVPNKPKAVTNITPLPLASATTVMQWVKAYQQGDQSVREPLAQAILSRAQRTIMFTAGTLSDRDDLTQNAVIRIFNAMPDYRGDAGIFAWIDRIAINIVRDHLRRFRLMPRLFSSPDEERALAPCAPEHSPLEALEQTELAERLAHHFHALKPDWRIPLVLTLAHGYTAPEIASLLNQKPETIKKRIQRARAALLSRLRNDAYCMSTLGELGR